MRKDSQLTGEISRKRAPPEPVFLTIVPEDRSTATGGPQQVEQYANSGSLARAVEPEKTENLSLIDFEVELADGGEFSVAFGQPAN